MKRFGVRIGLSAFLLVACAAGVLIGLVGRAIKGRTTYISLSNPSGECRWEAKWRVSPGRKEELCYLVFWPPGATYQVDSWNWTGGTPRGQNVTAIPEGLFVNGQCVTGDSVHRVFVYTKSGEMRPIDLEMREVSQLTFLNMQRFAQTKIWRDKLRDIVIANSWKES